ncbi:MAG TPA: heme-binding protein [Planctomycetota bacterium]|nr:heme-binding protein [Planctomycetota bacterium]
MTIRSLIPALALSAVTGTALYAADYGPPSEYCSKIPTGFSATVFAKPPAVSYPVQVCATATGEVFVTCDGNGAQGRDPKRGRIVRLVDADHDGTAERSDVFVADVDSPRGITWDSSTLYCLHPPNITAYRDTNGDGKVDKAEDIVTDIGWPLSHLSADHASNGLRLGIDGWIYCAIGDMGFPEAKGKDGIKITWRGGAVMRVRPDGSELEVFVRHTRNIFDVAMSPLLDGFIYDNTNDGDGWNSRFSYLVSTAEMGYPSLYKRFGDELMPPLKDFGGGSAVGSLFVDEVALPGLSGGTLLTCDWGTSSIYRNTLTTDGAGWKGDTRDEWAKVERVTDVDVDGSGRFYASSWKGAVFNYNGENVGAVVQFKPSDAKAATFPDLKKAGEDDLLKYLASTSGVLRLKTSQKILRRDSKPALKTGLLALAKDTAATLPARIAAIFTYKQAVGVGANKELEALCADATVQEWALRALADRKSQVKGVSAEPFLAGLKSENPRVRVQALIGLGRIGKIDAAKAIIPLAAVSSDMSGSARIIPHIAVRTLIELRAIDACLDAVDPGASPAQVDGALWALKYLHDPKTVKGLTGKLSSGAAGFKQKVITTLARLYYLEGEWDRKTWWGTRPDFQGPYFARATWAGTPAIEAALIAAVKTDASLAGAVQEALDLHKVQIKGLSSEELAKKRTQDDAALLAKAQAASKKVEGKVIGNLKFEDVQAVAVTTKGDPKVGEQLFLRQGCIACYTVSCDLPQKGPFLGEIARQYNRSELVESILKPSAKISQGFATRWFDLKDGSRAMGFVTREGAENIEMRDITGNVRDLPTADIVKRGEDKNSMMPLGLVNNCSAEELASLLAYFELLAK